MITGFIIHFYITFGTNLLTGGPSHIAVLLLVSVFRRKGISNGVQTERNLRHRDFFGRLSSWRLGVDVKKQMTRPRGRGRAYPLGAPSTLEGPTRVEGVPLPRGLLDCFLTSTPSLLDHVCSKVTLPKVSFCLHSV